MLKRTVVGVIAALACIGLLWIGKIAIWLLVGAVLLLGTHELLQALEKGGMHPFRVFYYLYALLSVPVVYFGGEKWLLLLLTLGVSIAMGCAVLRGDPDPRELLAAVLPVIYPVLPAMCMGVMLRMEFEPWRLLFLMVVAPPLCCDVAALFVGRRFGKHKLMDRISPNKTVEGAVGGVVGSLIGVLALYFIYPGHSLWMFLLIGLITPVFSQMGDLAASYIKRFCGIKDFGNLMPGHGGILDRVDSVLFSVGLVCFFVTMFGI